MTAEWPDFEALRRSAGNLTARDLVDVAMALGWTPRTGRGSHHAVTKPGRRTIVVPERLPRRVALTVLRDLEREARG